MINPLKGSWLRNSSSKGWSWSQGNTFCRVNSSIWTLLYISKCLCPWSVLVSQFLPNKL